MKNRKGFTLIEIIICIAIIAIVGTVSFVGVKEVFDSNKITSLSEVEDEILTAFDIYLETNDDVRKQLYDAENAIITPIQLLINEGLLDLSDTAISKKDIKENYIVTAFMSDSENDFTCTNAKDIRTITSWDENLSQPLYICTTIEGGDGGDTYNIFNIIGNSKVVLSKNRKYVHYNYNYVSYTDKSGTVQGARLLYIEPNGESYVLVKNGSFGDFFKGNTINLTAYENSGCNNSGQCIYAERKCISNCEGKYDLMQFKDYKTYNDYTKNSIISSANNINEEVNIDLSDIKDAVSSGVYGDYIMESKRDDWNYVVSEWRIGNGMSGVFPAPASYALNAVTSSKLRQYFKTKVKSCINIKDGDGTAGNPYILENNCEEES